MMRPAGFLSPERAEFVSITLSGIHREAAMINKAIVVTVALLVGLTGCVSEYKKEEKEEKAAKTMPVNCATAEGDIRSLNAEKANAAKEAAAGVTAIVPIGLVVGLVTGTEGQKIQLADGSYDKALNAAITRIKTTCNIP
jgi:hypothetical protein